MKLKEPNSKLVRWRLKLEEYDYEIIYKKGKYNTNADALSRIQINALDDDIQSMINNVDPSEIREINTPPPEIVNQMQQPSTSFMSPMSSRI